MASTKLRTQAEDSPLAERFHATRALTEALCEPLSESDATIQSMEDASPAKWHLAHTTWFWETFLLRDHLPDYSLHDERWPFLFNSYYEAEGERIGRFSRGMLSRPSVDEVLDWRAAVTQAMGQLLDHAELAPLIELGVAHEQQHQELLLTDIKHALFQNPLGPAMFDGQLPAAEARERGWTEHPGGIGAIGHTGEGFAFDCEGPRHRVLLEPFALADTLVTNAEWDAFIADGGYENAALWLSDGWAWVQENRIAAPLYWRDGDNGAEHFTLAGWQPRDPHAPVTHISYYEADAFASWAGHRLPTEFEWEAVARGQHAEQAPAHDPAAGNQLDTAGPVHPVGSPGLFGDCWQFTRSAYLPYPRFQPAEGAVGEYNGKFMSGQFVLKGASCATARGHSRASYRNFFYPHQRWQFTGLRLAKDI
ncbi:ergothioneine biosynthesis protein EgtB [Alteriqipengyuania sp. NZ-12B]|uniref:Ergothioneine biosynthesis protein EgtB n=1 Tax=Alteriqipengyuania abyssalis TaxID=2860200 RepID=A0ABS7PED7_9SPHN|nr:ergothioneine biosynthesis protein EgtB [Alteriqipengyuania abyssalis]